MTPPVRTRIAWRVIRLLEPRPVMQLPADRIRAAADRRRRLLRLPGASLLMGRADPAAVITDSSMTLDDGTVLPLRVYRPRATGSGPLPVVVNFHGGGWVSGDPRQSEWWASTVAAATPAVVVSVDYRLAPEHPFPVPAEDCYAAARWVAEHAAEFGGDGDRLAVSGDSAGGNLAAVVCVMARDRGGPRIGLQILVYPSVDMVGEYPSRDENADAPILSSKDMDNVPRLYLPAGTDEKDPYVSPLYADHHGLPKALIQTAQYDPLRDQGPAYAAALRDAGVPVRVTNYERAVHGFISVPTITTGGRQAVAEAVAELRSTLR